MSTRAHIEYDPMRRGVRLCVARENATLIWPPVGFVAHTDASKAPPEDAWLRLAEDDARAIYEALAEYFGHAGHDIRTLRKDYEAERGRVDRLINNLIGSR